MREKRNVFNGFIAVKYHLMAKSIIVDVMIWGSIGVKRQKKHEDVLCGKLTGKFRVNFAF